MNDFEVLIEEEISKFVVSYIRKNPTVTPDDAFNEYFNNFYLNLPNGARRKILKNPNGNPEAMLGRKKAKEFFLDIDSAIEKSDIVIDEVKNLQSEAGYNDIKKALYSLVFPAYVLLRSEGYTKYDLTG